MRALCSIGAGVAVQPGLLVAGAIGPTCVDTSRRVGLRLGAYVRGLEVLLEPRGQLIGVGGAREAIVQL
jgi:hypothetical protein